MSSIEALKKSLIERISTSTDESLLEAIMHLIETFENEQTNFQINESQARMIPKEQKKEEVYQLTAAQLKALKQGEEDFKHGRFVTQEELDKMDEEWLG